MCPYLEYENSQEREPAAKCICRLVGCLMSTDDLMVQFICSGKYDEYRSCKKYKVYEIN